MKIKKYIVSKSAQTKQWILSVVICRLFGHRINRYLIEYSNQKECMRCGKTITVWDIMTVEDFEKENGI